MDVALVTGYGPALLTRYDAFHPLVQETDVVVCGYRDVVDPATYSGRAIFATHIHCIDLPTIRQQGIVSTANAMLPLLTNSALAGFWVHLDADVLQDEWMPAVDSRQPDGFTAAELITLLQQLLATESIVGMDITIFDPSLDPDGQIAAAFTSAIVDAFTADDG